MNRRVLVVDDDRAVREALGQTLELADCDAVLAGSFVEAKDHINAAWPGIIVSDVRMPGRDGFHLLAYARTQDAELPVILLTGQGDIPMAVAAMDQGAFAFLEKPCAPSSLMAGVERALRTREEVLENRRLRLKLDSGDAAARMLHGTSELARGLRDRVRKVARAGADVLVRGEAGSGTSKVAEVIHLLSAGARHPFVKRTAAQVTPQTLEQAFSAAGAGTLYLEEIASLPDDAQFALLDALETGQGARLIAGSTRDLGAASASGAFSGDLFHRLDVMQVRIPSLRERIEDIPDLFRHYVAQASEQANVTPPEIDPDVLARLMARDWPGNARALMNAAMRFTLGLGDADAFEGLSLPEQMAKVERQLLIAALRRNGGRGTDTARALKLPRKTFYDKLSKHDLRAEDYRDTAE